MAVAEDQPYIHRLSALGIEAQRCGRGVEFVTEGSTLICGGTLGWDQGDHLKQATMRAGLDLAELDAAREAAPEEETPPWGPRA